MLTDDKICPRLVSTNRPSNEYTGNIYTLHSNIRYNNKNVDAETKIDLLILVEIKK